ncbi:MAG TPA: methyltransferase domain-containing protein [Alphaproteobacteria bacterium]|jgi:ubiquinone/menaquinone biosynthesis C-methylase UbiE|nr:methyltransferase domain-containing protein [Alphaproteobacteria bacterium]
MSRSDSSIDKDYTRRYWRDRAAYWDRSADSIADVADRLNQPLLDAIGIAPGQSVLDLASGAGEPALSIARRVGSAGRVTATDLVAEMLAGAERRAADAGLANIDFRIADMEAMPFGDAVFDRVSCRFGIMFTSDPGRALAEARRVLRPGGRAGFLVWGPRDDISQFEVFAAAAARVFGDAADLDLERPFRFGQAGSLGALMTAAGFAGAEEQELRFEPRIPASVPFWRPQVEMTFGPVLAYAAPDRRQALEEALHAGFAALRQGDHYRLRMHVRIVTGTR